MFTSEQQTVLLVYEQFRGHDEVRLLVLYDPFPWKKTCGLILLPFLK